VPDLFVAELRRCFHAVRCAQAANVGGAGTQSA
jgi:hypothetical protein